MVPDRRGGPRHPARPSALHGRARTGPPHARDPRCLARRHRLAARRCRRADPRGRARARGRLSDDNKHRHSTAHHLTPLTTPRHAHPGAARRSPYKEPKHETHHRPHPRPLAHPAQLGGLEGAVRAARTRGPRAGLAPHGARGRGPPPQPVRPERARPRRGRRPLRPDHPRPRHPAGDHGALHRRPADRTPARPRPRRGRGRPVARAGEGRAAPAADAASHGLPGAPQPGEPKEDHPADAQAVPLRLHEHHERRGCRGGLRALLRSRPRPGGLPGGVRQRQSARRDQGRFPQGRPPAAARDRQRSGPHDPGLGEQGGREAPRQVEGRRGLQGVRGTPPLHGRRARLGSGGRLRTRVGEPPRRCASQTPRAGRTGACTPAPGSSPDADARRSARRAHRPRRASSRSHRPTRPQPCLGDGAMPPSGLRRCHPQQKGPFPCP